MTETMIDQLEMVHRLDDSSYLETFATIGQLFFTTIECMEIDGDRWVKVIIIIYTIMSVLQTVSLIALHKQTSAFSVFKDANTKTSAKNDDPISTKKEYKSELSEDVSSISTKNEDNTESSKDNLPVLIENEDSGILPKTDASIISQCLDKLKRKKARTAKLRADIIEILTAFAGIIVLLFMGIWADYNSHSVTEWLVISWFLCPLLICTISTCVFCIERNAEKTTEILLVPSLIIPFGLVTSATVIGYLPK
ncbi:hypothetical protein J3Q64DRAFT_1743579 [Phycomyces blakesleeanus]|uniref:Uncharacterized protein n=1 Tax=Phycomyces blakesleeanus TaxID=4837 RepID=A0ABR3AYB7_PHYBL